ncbi:MAG TPA: helix-hairpin-helix domain-containing protein [Steroidobacteraceae bacterium]|nr:helix-hairpin-helix domain-containing protein [Steroidobacteraceae bacterium]
MTVAFNDAPGRPPYIQFREDYAEDREETLKQGRYVSRPVHLVIIRQAGSKDSVEKLAEEWLETLPRNPNMRPEWVDAYRKAYKTWKEDRSVDTVVQGTHVRLWPAISKPMADALLNAQCRTVEDLASANEETIGRVGIGARELQQKARAWLEAAQNTGKVAEEVLVLRAKAEADSERIKALEARLSAMAAGIVNKPKTVTPEDDFS